MSLFGPRSAKENPGISIMSLSKGGKWNNSRQTKAGFDWLHVKLDRRLLDALKRESEARGGSQERRITEEALAIYFGLRGSAQANGTPSPIAMAGYMRGSQARSRIVE
jgi:hypothetical protein